MSSWIWFSTVEPVCRCSPPAALDAGADGLLEPEGPAALGPPGVAEATIGGRRSWFAKRSVSASSNALLILSMFVVAFVPRTQKIWVITRSTSRSAEKPLQIPVAIAEPVALMLFMVTGCTSLASAPADCQNLTRSYARRRSPRGARHERTNQRTKHRRRRARC
jgi:hypothetical protein